MTASLSNAKQRVAAVIVTFRPDHPQLNRLIATISGECAAIYLMDNGGGREAIADICLSACTLHYVDMGGNAGIGAALNRGLHMAIESKFDYVTTFDQDSGPMGGQIIALVGALELLTSTGVKVAAVGPRIVDLRGDAPVEHAFMRRSHGWPRAVYCGSSGQSVETDLLVTSGSVICLTSFAHIGEFDPSLFVDFTDTDWCLRALAHGYRLFGICTISMEHELGSGVSARALGIKLLRYAPIRRYYYARNIILLSRRGYVSLGWKARLLMGLLSRLFILPLAGRASKSWSQDWLMLMRGIVDGLAGRDGEYAGPR
jgi:rhamnosyltransferase